ncbi:MAG: methylenetetrahydrofolate reductase [Deltaproteobacteria bacterium]|nr:methylenetetrahydrofolate reductase [Deltaproteobacteria bacterium]
MTPLEQLVSQAGPQRPLLCLEVNPPRGASLDGVFARLDGKLEGIDLLNVTDCALAKMRFGALPFASILKQRYKLESLVNLSCRDRNIIALQGDLLAGWATGVRAIVALTGDAVSIGDFPDSKGVFEINSVGLLHLISTLNSGKDLAGNELTGATAFVPGAVVNPNVKNVNAELRRLAKKKDAGATFALSQPVFDVESSSEFFREAQKIGIKLFVGLMGFKSRASVGALSKIPGIKVPDNILSAAQDSQREDLSEFSIEQALRVAEGTRPYVAGFHVISGATPKLAIQLAGRLADYIKRI